MKDFRLRLATVVAALTAALAIGACGGDDETSGGGGGSEEPPSATIVGAQDGTTGETYANDETDAAEVRGFPQGPDAVSALVTGQVDAVIIDQPVAVKAVEDTEGIEVVQEITTDELYGFPMSPENSELIDAVNGALATLKQDGTIDELYEKYFQTQPPESVTETSGDPEDAAAADLGVVAEGELLVGTDAPYAPFEIGTPEDGDEFTGYDIEVMNAVAEELGLDPSYQNTSFNTIFRDTASGQFDIAAAASTITPEREQTVTFSEPYYEAQQALLVPEGSAIESVDDITGG